LPLRKKWRNGGMEEWSVGVLVPIIIGSWGVGKRNKRKKDLYVFYIENVFIFAKKYRDDH